MSVDLASAPLEALLAEVERRRVASIVAALRDASAEAAPAFVEEGALCRRYGVEPRACREARRAGELAGHRVGRRVVLEVAAFERWIAGQRIEAPKAARTDVDDDAIEAGLVGGTLVRLPQRSAR